MRATQVPALLLAALLLLPVAGHAQSDVDEANERAQAAALAPLDVVLRGLPDTMRVALNESAYQLLSDTAQAELAEAQSYVAGFSTLPPGEGKLQDAEVRAAYAWVEDVVQAIAAIPATLDGSQRSFATCAASFRGVPAADPEGTIVSGRDAIDVLAVVRLELQGLLAAAPAVLDPAPLAEAIGLVEGYWVDSVPTITDCLDELEAQLESGAIPRIALKAVVLPNATYPGGSVRVLGTAPAGSAIRIQAPTLGVDARPGLVRGSFRQGLAIADNETLGTHRITVTAGDLRVELRLEVGRVPVRLDLGAPGRAVANTTFTATLAAVSVAPAAAIDAVPVTLTWRDATQTIRLKSAAADVPLPAGAPADGLVLRAEFPGNARLLPAVAERRVDVELPSPAAASAPTFLGIAQPAGLDWFWWILIGVLAVAFGLVLYLSPVAIHRLRPVPTEVVRGRRPPPRWPGAATFAAAVAALFTLLRRVNLVPPGRTVQEWVRGNKAPRVLADQFDAVRYGEQAESEALRAQGIPWAQDAWERSKPKERP